jgi:D-3-phosphoglycerate dehydrogenase
VSAPNSILVLDSLFDDLEVESQAAATRGWSVGRWDGSEEDLLDAEVVVHVRTRVNRQLLEHLPMCRVIGRFGTGLDTVDLQAAAARGIEVVNVRDYCTPEMTLQTLALAFSLLRGIAGGWSNESAQSHDWTAMADGEHIRTAQTAVVIGYGAIGSSVARALSAVGMCVLVVSQHGAARAEADGLEVVSVTEGASRADLILLHSALTPETSQLVNEHLLETFRPGAILVNTARLDLMDHRAVAQAVASDQLGGLGLDAIIPAESPLRRILDRPKVLVTPHVGWYSPRSASTLRSSTVIRSIDSYESSRAKENLITEEGAATAPGGGSYE